MVGTEDSILVFAHYAQTFRLAGDQVQAKDYATVLVKLLPVTAGPADQSIEFGYCTIVEYFVSEHQPALAEKYANLNLARSAGDPNNKSLT